MAMYNIDIEQDLGMSHSGSIVAAGRGTIELSDEEVQTLIQLIREKKTADIKKLGLETSHPKLYEKLDDVYRSLTYKTVELHWLREGYHKGYFRYSTNKVIGYCESHCGYEFTYNDVNYLKKDGTPNKAKIRMAKEAHFCDWLNDYVDHVEGKDARVLFYDYMNAELDLYCVDYTIAIPQAIIDMAKEK